MLMVKKRYQARIFDNCSKICVGNVIYVINVNPMYVIIISGAVNQLNCKILQV